MQASQSTSANLDFSRFLQGWRAAVLLLITCAAPLWHLHAIHRIFPYNYNDLTSRWIGSQAALRGQNPYSPEVTRQIQTAYYGRPLDPSEDREPQEFAYPLYVALLIAPLTHLSLQKACLGFVLAVAPLLLIGFFLCARAINLQISSARTALIAVLALFSWPAMWGLRLQQLTLPVAAFVFIAFYLLMRRRNGAAGALLALAMIKPQLVVPLILWLFVWAILRRSWSFIAAFLATFGFLLLWAQVKLPGWLRYWREDLHGYGPHTALPLQTICGHWPGLIATILLAAYCVSVLWRLRHAPPGSTEFALAFSLALASTLSLTLTKLPVIYNQVLLMPGCVILVQKRPARYYPAIARFVAITALLWTYAAVCISSLGEILFKPSAVLYVLPLMDQIFPVLVAFALALSLESPSSGGCKTTADDEIIAPLQEVQP
jgi:hypothetical protein